MAQIEMFATGQIALPATEGHPMSAKEFGDIDVLFNNVMDRLLVSAGDRSSPTGNFAMGPYLQSAARECARALSHLHATFKCEHGFDQRHDLEVFELQAALARSRAELAGTKLGGRLARPVPSEDGLATLPDKTLFHERLDYALKLAAPQRRAFAVLYLDLDGFEPISASQGQECADELLKIVATRMTHAVRAEDMVSQLGDDEFGCLLADLPSREQLGALATKLIDAVSAPVKVGKLRFTVKPTIGVATCPADGVTGEMLIRNADAAMRRAKKYQTGHAFFDAVTNH